MNNLWIKTAVILAVLNLVAVFYINFSAELTLAAQFLVLPWLALQSLVMISMTKHHHGEC